jgi:hypothetical protein
MRKILAASALAAGLVAALPAAPASAVCVDLRVDGFRCMNPCGTAYGVYKVADRAVKDAIPNDLFQCLA